jgi:ATP-dependent DNA helicase RecG
MKKENDERFPLIIAEGEGERIEFKEEMGQIDREMIAFANTAGGSIFIGIDDRGKIKGIDITNRLLSNIHTIARNCDPPLNMETFVHVGKILEIRVPEGKDKPYRCKSGFYLRVGPNTQKLSRNEIRRLILTAGTYRFDESVNERFEFPQDFDEHKLKSFLNLCGIHVRASSEDILLSLDVAVRHGDQVKLNQAGVLFFAKEPQSFIKESYVSCVRYRGSDRYNIIDRQEIYGTPIEQIENVLAFIKRNIKVGYTFGGNARREETYEYAIPAVREATTNAVMHRDYYYDASHTYISIFSDRIEIDNPGGLYSGITLDDLGKRSVRRNRLVADLLFRAGYVERVGSGIYRMKKSLEMNNNPPMDIVATNFFLVVFYPRIEALETANLSQRQYHLYQLVKIKGQITKKEIAQQLDVSEDTALRDLRSMIEAGLIDRQGIGKSTKYTITGKEI